MKKNAYSVKTEGGFYMRKDIIDKPKLKILRVFNNKNSKDELVKQIILIKNMKDVNKMSERR